jgi:hypothetical protein
MKKIISALVIALAWATTADAVEKHTFVVTYLSVEHVYINGGSTDRIQIGDGFEIGHRNGNKSELLAIFVAGHSACCSVLVTAGEIRAGDQVALLPREPANAIASDAPTAGPETGTTVTETPAVVRYAPTPLAQLNGNMSFVLYYGDDRSPSNLDFTQSTARLQLKARRLWGKDITLAIRSRGRFDHRLRDYSTNVTQHDWQNRLWEFALYYEPPDARVHVFAGRMLPRRVGAIGYLDGLVLEARFSNSVRAGVFGGAQPHWLYDDHGVTLTKAGGYVSVVHGRPGQTYWEQSLAVIGEYHGDDVSRELLAMQGRVSSGNRWGFYHTVEFDVNRGWRKDKAGQSISMSGLHAGGHRQVTRDLRANLSYDSRTSYWTYETRGLVDSLFDDHLRQGVHARLDARLPGRIQISGSVGYRKREGDPEPGYNYSLRLSRNGLLTQNMSLSLQWAEFTGPTDHGGNYGVQMNYSGRAGNLGAGYDLYTYSTTLDEAGWTNHRIELSGQADMARHYFLGGLIQFMSGDDLKGIHVQSELGVRF